MTCYLNSFGIVSKAHSQNAEDLSSEVQAQLIDVNYFDNVDYIDDVDYSDDVNYSDIFVSESPNLEPFTI